MTTIKDAPIVELLIGTEKFPISNDSGKPVTATINQILEKVPEPDLTEYATKKELPTKLSLLTNDANYIQEDSLVLGVYAVTPTNRLVDLEHADTSCVGVAVFMPDIKYIINKHDLNDSLTLYWGKNLKGLDVPGIENVGQYGFDFTGGKNNTNALISSYTTLGVEMDDRDVSKSLQTFYASGDTDWYIPSNGLLMYMYTNFAKINEILSKIGGTLLNNTTEYWSSNESSTEIAITALLKEGSNILYPIPKDSLCRVRLVKDLSEQKLVKERIYDLENKVDEIEQFKGTIGAVDTNDSVDEPEINNSINVLDNGNIKVTINGVSKDFMPATPSGDPMHYYYESLGAQWNDGDDKTLQIPIYGKDSDTIEYMSVVHKSKHWYLNLLGDITNAQMAEIVSYPRTISGDNSYSGCNARSVIYEGNGSASASFVGFCSSSMIESLYTNKMMYPKSQTGILFGNNTCKYILGNPNNNSYYVGYNGITCTKDYAQSLKEIRISHLRKNSSFSGSPSLPKTSVLFMVNEADPTTAITITLHSTAYARVANDEEVIAALDAKNAALQGTGGSVSIVSA